MRKPKTNTVAAIDCGTNSIRLLIAKPAETTGTGEVSTTLALDDIAREMVITRLGQGVDHTGILNPEALERTLEVARQYKQVVEDERVKSLRVVATSASRDAENSEDFLCGMKEILGVSPEIITGEEEANLSFLGAISSLPPNLEAPYLVVDIGGGSTEFVLGTDSAEETVSVNMGSVRVSERFGGEPWTKEKLREATEWIDHQLDAAARIVDFTAAKTVVGLAGTVTTIGAFLAGVEEYDPEVTHGLSPSYDRWLKGIDFMISGSVEEKDALPIMPAGRGDVIGGGALIWRQILRRLAKSHGGVLPPVVVSEHDILDGLALAQIQ